MASQKIDILVTGATGYIGGSVVERLLNHPDASKFNITALVRSPEKAEKLRALGINTVVGSHEETDKMRKLASETDIVIAMADCDALEVAKNTLLGLKDRFEATGKKPIYINTSGTATCMDAALGKYTSETIYDDMNADQIEALPATQPHRPVDSLIVEADKQGYINSYIIVPSTVYGIAKGRFVDLEIQKAYSFAIPFLVKTAFLRDQAIVVGEGKNVWNCVHIDDTADLYLHLFNALIANPSSVGHGREGYFFGENGEYYAHDVAKAVAKALSARGIGKEDPIPLSDEEAKQFPWYLYGTNTRTRGNRGRALGWKPTHTTEDLLSSIDPEAEIVLKTLRRAE